MAGEQIGEAVLNCALAQAQGIWGARLLGAFALGSLAHGGFSALVSDVDLGLLLEDPIGEEDASRVARLSKQVTASGLDLAGRLSVFWGSPSTLRGDASAGRFPPLDRLDLIRYGRLLAGADARAGLPEPSYRELVLPAAEMGLNLLQRLAQPEDLVASGPRPLTKAVLFPVRFLYTARTGDIGRNHDAVQHFVAHESGPPAELAAAALRWREDPAVDLPAAIALVRAGLPPIYQLFLEDYAERTADYGLPDLAGRLRAARASLVSSGISPEESRSDRR